MEAPNPYDRHIPADVFRSATSMAFEDVQRWTEKFRLPWAGLSDQGQLDCPGPSTRATDATHFAQVIGDVGVTHRIRLPGGYASWLMVDRRHGVPFGIALHSEQMRQWSQDPNLPTVYEDAQEARCILHELGHVRVTPNLLKRAADDPRRPPAGLTAKADPEDEVGPWMYAVAILGTFLAQHALETRRKVDTDNAPCIQI